VTPSELGAAVRAAVADAVEAGELVVAVPADVAVERPRVKEHGDYATSIALQLAKSAGRPPREIAELLAARLRQVDGIREVDVAGPGFLNLRLADDALGQGRARRRRRRGGVRQQRRSRRAAHQPGVRQRQPHRPPAHRWCAVGSGRRRPRPLLEASGATVGREYYINDAGNQFDLFAASMLARATGRELPENGYQGRLRRRLRRADRRRAAGRLELPEDDALAGLPRARAAAGRRRHSGARSRPSAWSSTCGFSELSLEESGRPEQALKTLREQGTSSSQDGAVWLRTTDFGDDKDRVLVKGDGVATYFMSDAAYYLDKRGRASTAASTCWCRPPRLRRAAEGDRRRAPATTPRRRIDVLIGQLVNVVKDGEVLRQSKRLGQYTSLDDLVG
jgi:arginyl-tRNA synthetase